MMKILWILLTLLCIVRCAEKLKNFFTLSREDNGAIKYQYQKTYWPHCSRVDIVGKFESMEKPSLTEPQRVTITTQFERVDTDSFLSSVRLNPGYIHYAYYYEGLLTPRVNWFRAEFTLNCYYLRKGYNTKTATITKAPKSSLGGLFYPKKGRMAVAALAKDWNWDQLHVQFETFNRFYHPAGFYQGSNNEKKWGQCYPSGATLTTTGVIIVECGMFELYGLTEYRIHAYPQVPGLPYGNDAADFSWHAYQETYYHEGYLNRVFLPLPMILTKTKYVQSLKVYDAEGSYLEIEYLHQLYTAADYKFFQIEEDKRFSDATSSDMLYNVTDDQHGRCKDTGAIRNNGEIYVSQSSEYGDSEYPAILAVNGDRNDFTHTDSYRNKWWMVYKSDWVGLGYLALWNRDKYNSRLSNFYILTAKEFGRLTPVLHMGIWTQQKYFRTALGARRTDFQFHPIIQLDHLAIYSVNPTDALSLSEIETYSDCLMTFKARGNLPPGVDYILTAFQYGVIGVSKYVALQHPGLPSRKVYARFHVKALNNMVDDKTCKSYKYDVLKEYYGCKANGTLTDERKNECRARNPATLKDLLDCLTPYKLYDEILADKEQPKKWPEDSVKIDRNYVSYVKGTDEKAPIAESLFGEGNISAANLYLLIILLTISRMFL